MTANELTLNSGLVIVLIGFLLDSLLGDPRCLPHPIRFFGRMISWFESRMNTGKGKKFRGALMWFALIVLTGSSFFLAEYLIGPYPVIFCLFGGLFFFYGISNRSLIEEALKVEASLQGDDIEAARKQLSMIVGRDTEHLNPTQIRIAVLETLSENLSDGVIAPMFYYIIGGIPCMMVYKMINTLDSMVGYRNDRFLEFGYFSAKMDDVVNFIPSRLTALLMALVSLDFRTFRFVVRYGKKHASPNSGYPESALAGILNCRFGGSNLYQGREVVKPYIGSNDREIHHRDLIRACCINAIVALLGCIGSIFFLFCSD